MKTACRILALLAVAGCSLSAESLSYTGILATPESVFEQAFTLSGEDTVFFQTWSFGGGTNAAGQVIPAGGFDPLLTLFSGTGPDATIVTDGGGNPIADGDLLANPPWSYVGNCPSAGTVAIGVNSDCGDDEIQVALPPGTYTLLLTDAAYTPNAVYDNGALSEGFTDFTAGVFQTCDTDGSCITPSGNFAVDIVSSSLAETAPEPMALLLFVTGLTALAVLNKLRNPKQRRSNR
jgi:hypothetical protein